MMKSSAMILRIVIAALVSTLVTCGLTNKYSNSEILDDEEKYKLHWTVNPSSQSISFGIEATTTGWVALGFSSVTSSSSLNDIVIGYVDSTGKGHLEDRHGNTPSTSFIDTVQNYDSVSASESNGKTFLEFTRKLLTSDSNDTDIQNDRKLEVIYAYGDTDNVNHIVISKLGSKCINFFTFPKGSYCSQDVLEVTMSVRKTEADTFLCRAFKLSELVNEERYIVKIEPIIEEKYKNLVHHIALFSCPDDFDNGAINKNTECYDENAPKSVRTCAARSVVSLWTKGVKTFTFPKHVGYPIRGENNTKYILLETYFRANKNLDTDVITGFRLFHEKKRQYKSDVLTTGYRISGSMVIPPGQNCWISTSYCTKGCTERIQNSLAIEGNEIKFFAWMPHAHEGVNAMWANLVRDDKIIKEIVRKDNYNTSNEQIQMLKSEITFKAEDEIVTYCRYNTANRKDALYGGPLESQAVCLSFFMFYPRINFSSCISEEHRIYKEFSMKYAGRVYKAGFGVTYNKSRPAVPSQYRNWTGVKWNEEMVKELKDAYAYNGKDKVKQVCMQASSNSYTNYDTSKPKINPNAPPCSGALNIAAKPVLIAVGSFLVQVLKYMVT